MRGNKSPAPPAVTAPRGAVLNPNGATLLIIDTWTSITLFLRFLGISYHQKSINLRTTVAKPKMKNI